MTAPAPSSSITGRFSDEVATIGRVVARLRVTGLRREDDEIPAVEAALDDLEKVLDEFTDLSDADIRELEPRFRLAFRRWLMMARMIGVHLDPRAATLAYRVLAEPLPPDYLPALAHVRRLALVVQDLMERCIQAGGP
jgi:hypothetical protein